MSVIQDLQSRGLIAQTTDIEALDALLNEQKNRPLLRFSTRPPTACISVTCCLYWHCAVSNRRDIRQFALVGGATGMIGDPSFKAVERSLNSAETVAGWVESIRNQLKPFLSFEGENAAYYGEQRRTGLAA